jgi:RNA polymerase sigma factor (TIGR02999 family)
MKPEPDITDLLRACRQDDRRALDALFELIYDQLHRIARGQRRRWRGNLTLNTTALIHEAYVKLAGQEELPWESRSHFFAVAATAMRQVLVNYAAARAAAKRGGDARKVTFEDSLIASSEKAEEVLALDEALKRLEGQNERQCRVVECRFFAGLTVEQTAEALGLSPATVKRDWGFASAWLYRELEGDLFADE